MRKPRQKGAGATNTAPAARTPAPPEKTLPAKPGRGAPGIPKPNEDEIRERREKTFELRRVLGLTYEQIVQWWSQQTPPVQITRRTVVNYLHDEANALRARYKKTNFDGREHVAMLIERYEFAYRWNMRKATLGSTPPAHARGHFRVAMEALDRETKLLQDVGLLDKTLGVLLFGRLEEGEAAEKIPSGIELGKWFDRVQVVDGEIVSEAERSRRQLPAKAEA